MTCSDLEIKNLMGLRLVDIEWFSIKICIAQLLSAKLYELIFVMVDEYAPL